MPDRPLTVLTYAASASLAAVALAYFFNPQYLIDGDAASGSANARKKGVVGLFNPANDCFINSILQSLAGLGDLRLYLIRETHRRDLDGPAIYEAVSPRDPKGKEVKREKVASLQSGEVTRGLKDMIDRLNERPLSRKTISATPFIHVLEHAFGTRISKSQQDAQELLQIVAERLLEEYHAGTQARRNARRSSSSLLRSTDESPQDSDQKHAEKNLDKGSTSINGHIDSPSKSEQASKDRAAEDEERREDGFPLEGRMETRTECTFCKFVPKVKPSSFVMLTLIVPQKSSTTLNECLDGHFKTEYIDDYNCDRCRLVHARELREKELLRTKSAEDQRMAETAIAKLERAIKVDPEMVPENITMPDSKLAPKRKIARYSELTQFPRILVIHLSRSLYDLQSSSTKNMSKLSFPETLPMGGLLRRKHYKLLGVVTHKGTHNSGHYETFRRQHTYPPYANPLQDSQNGPYSPHTIPPIPTLTVHAPTERGLGVKSEVRMAEDCSTQSSSPPPSSMQSPLSTRPSSGATVRSTAGNKPGPVAFEQATFSLDRASQPSSARSDGLSREGSTRFRRKKKPADRWWRISDDNIRECKTSDVLGMQKEVYMLFYEMQQDNSG